MPEVAGYTTSKLVAAVGREGHPTLGQAGEHREALARSWVPESDGVVVASTDPPASVWARDYALCSWLPAHVSINADPGVRSSPLASLRAGWRVSRCAVVAGWLEARLALAGRFRPLAVLLSSEPDTCY